MAEHQFANGFRVQAHEGCVYVTFSQGAPDARTSTEVARIATLVIQPGLAAALAAKLSELTGD